VIDEQYIFIQENNRSNHPVAMTGVVARNSSGLTIAPAQSEWMDTATTNNDNGASTVSSHGNCDSKAKPVKEATELTISQWR